MFASLLDAILRKRGSWKLDGAGAASGILGRGSLGFGLGSGLSSLMLALCELLNFVLCWLRRGSCLGWWGLFRCLTTLDAIVVIECLGLKSGYWIITSYCLHFYVLSNYSLFLFQMTIEHYTPSLSPFHWPHKPLAPSLSSTANSTSHFPVRFPVHSTSRSIWNASLYQT